MKLSNLKIKNFRGFEDESIDFDDITVFIGENNTGKSTILDAIRFLLGKYEKLSRYDYRLTSAIAKPGDAGNIALLAEASESNENEWADEIEQALPECIDIDAEGLKHFYIALNGSYSSKDELSTQTKEFQNKSGGTKDRKANTAHNFSEFGKLLPAFYISSQRSSKYEFQSADGYFHTFLDSESINEEKRDELEDKLSTLNTEIVEVLGNINLLKENLKKSMSVLTGTDEATVDIEPLSSNLNDLIGKASVILHNVTGIKLPLEKHGSGAQSLSVLFLYEAYLTVLLQKEYDRFSEPVLLVEEPEAHLHPSAIRLFWRMLDKMPGQKIITTHSGDIISAIPFSKIRRIVGVTGTNRVKKLSDAAFDAKDKRILRNYITYSRGELFFAKCWLLVEGETEQAFFENILNRDGFLDRKGVRILQYTQLSIDVVLKLASQLEMRWFFVSDGDTAGQTYTQKAITAIPVGSQQDDFVYTFAEKTIEVHLMANGFDTFYAKKLSPQTQGKVSGNPGTVQYYDSIYDAIQKGISKPEIVLEVVEDIIQNGKSCPPVITQLRAKLEGML